MYGEPFITNPLGWAQIRLLGGWNRVLATGGVYAAAVLLMLVFIYRVMSPDMPLPVFARGALSVLMVIEVLVLFFVGVGSIKKAIHRDFTSDMISSHRLTRMSGHTAVLGYLTGATAQVWILTAVNVIAGTVLAALSGAASDAVGPALITLVLLPLAMVCWLLAILVGLSTRGATSISGVLVLLAGLVGWSVVLIVPGLGLLLNYPTVSRVFSAPAATIDDAWIVVAVLSEVVLSLALFLAAARKFARDDRSALTPLLAYAILAFWTLVLAVGLGRWTPQVVRGVSLTFLDPHVQAVSTLICIALVALLPVANAAKSSARWHTRRSKDPAFRGSAPRPSYESAFITTIVVFGVLLAVMGGRLKVLAPLDTAVALLTIAGAFLLAMMTAACLLRFVYSVTPKGLLFLVAFLVVFWLLPPLLDLGLSVSADSGSNAAFSPIFGCSPVGTWIIATGRGNETSVWPGLGFQLLVAFGAGWLAKRATRAKPTPAD